MRKRKKKIMIIKKNLYDLVKYCIPHSRYTILFTSNLDIDKFNEIKSNINEEYILTEYTEDSYIITDLINKTIHIYSMSDIIIDDSFSFNLVI